MSAPNLNALFAHALVDQLARGGIAHAVVAPGSRSTPLALACAARLRTHVVLDERSAAFVALGIGKATFAPAVVLATSGSAGAHFFPAVLEAEAAGIPLVALTADRPPELHGWGAPQTLDQAHLFGAHARFFADLGVPEPTAPALRHLRATAARAVERARTGPVHLNAPFREPLAPVVQPYPELADAPAAHHASAIGLPPLDEALRVLARAERGAIFVGPRDAQDGLPAPLGQLAHALGWPVLAEAASNVRFTVPGVVGHADALLRHAPTADRLRPDVVLRLGGGPTSKVVAQALDSAAHAVVIHERGEPVDPAHRAAVLLHGEAPAICAALARSARSRGTSAAAWGEAEAVARAAVDAALAAGPLGEPLAARLALEAVPEGGQLFVSSSMPVRDLDAFGQRAARGVRVLANRGLNGIDGIVSSALGAALATGRPTTALLGDLALLHDLGGLIAAARLRVDLTVVCVNNDGGGIFSFLPVAQETPRFEELFGTPHGLDLAGAGQLAGARFSRPATPAALRDALAPGPGLRLVEVRTDRARNVDEHGALHAAVAAALEAARAGAGGGRG